MPWGEPTAGTPQVTGCPTVSRHRKTRPVRGPAVVPLRHTYLGIGTPRPTQTVRSRKTNSPRMTLIDDDV